MVTALPQVPWFQWAALQQEGDGEERTSGREGGRKSGQEVKGEWRLGC